MKEKMISSGKELYRGFNQFRCSKLVNSTPVLIHKFATCSNEDLKWADLNNMELMLGELEEYNKDFNPFERCSSWISNMTPGGVTEIKELSKDVADDQNQGQLLLAQPEKNAEMQVEETTTAPEDIAMEVDESNTFPESVQKGESLSITDEDVLKNFVNLIGIHEILSDCSANEVYNPLNPLLNHLRRRLLAILRFCFDSENGDMVLTSLQNDDTWFCKGFSKKSLHAAISDIKWASSTTYFKQHKMQIQLDLAAGPFAIFEEIQAVRSMAKSKC